MVFYPDGRDNGATLVSTASDKQGVTNPNYQDEYAAYLRDKEISILMRQRHGVNM
jgi:hypothetical protein